MSNLDLDNKFKEYFVVDKIESLIFFISYSNTDLRQRMGKWYDIFNYMYMSVIDQEAMIENVSWNLSVRRMPIGRDGGFTITKYDRELSINIENSMIRVKLSPQYYYDKKMYCETKFSISAMTPDAMMLLHLYSHLFNK